MTAQGGRKRHVIAALGTVIAALAALLVASPASAHDEIPEGMVPEGDWTEEQLHRMLDMIDQVETVTPDTFPETYSNGGPGEAELEAAGFHNIGATAPGGYDHWVNAGWLDADHLFNPEFPESLVYQVQDDGSWELQAVMYMLPPDIEMDEIPEEDAWLPGWHGHPELCFNSEGTLVGLIDPDDPESQCPEGTRNGATPLMMHVWLLDPGCGHRFGGVGVGGLHCGHDDHEEGEHEDGHEEGEHEDGHEEGEHDDGHEHEGDGDMTADPAPPVAGQPSFTG